MKKTAVFKNSPILAKNEKKWKTEKEEKLGKEKKKKKLLPKKKSSIHDQIDRMQTNWTSHAAILVRPNILDPSGYKHVRIYQAIWVCMYYTSKLDCI